MLLKHSVNVCHHLSNSHSSFDLFPPLIFYHNPIKTQHIPLRTTLTLIIPTILMPQCPYRGPSRIGLHILFKNNSVFFLVKVVGHSMPSVESFLSRLCLPAAFSAFTAFTISLALRSGNISLESMTHTLVRRQRFLVFILDVLRTFSQNCLWVSCSISFSIIICWRPFDKESIMAHSSRAGVASPFTILTPCLANRQVLREVGGVEGIWFESFLGCACLVSLWASKMRLGFKGCIPAFFHVPSTFSLVYAHFRTGSNIL